MIPLSMIALFALFITQLAILILMGWEVVVGAMMIVVGAVLVGVGVYYHLKEGEL